MNEVFLRNLLIYRSILYISNEPHILFEELKFTVQGFAGEG